MSHDEIDVSHMVARGNNKSILNIMQVLLVYEALFGEERFKKFLEEIDKDMKKDGLYLKDYINLEEK